MMSLRFVCSALLLLLACSDVVSVVCPDGWMSHGQSCYLHMREEYNWFDAQVVCRTLGGFLAEDGSAEEHSFLAGLARQHGTQIWLGMQAFLEEGLWRWTHANQAVSLSFWDHGQPQAANEDCVGMSAHSGGWYDANCQEKRSAFVCELTPDDVLIG